MKRERTKTHDVIRQGATISIVERRSGVASSFVIPCEEAREALVRLLSEPIQAEADPSEETPAEPAEAAPPAEPEKKTTKKRTKKESAA